MSNALSCVLALVLGVLIGVGGVVYSPYIQKQLSMNVKNFNCPCCKCGDVCPCNR